MDSTRKTRNDNGSNLCSPRSTWPYTYVYLSSNYSASGQETQNGQLGQERLSFDIRGYSSLALNNVSGAINNLATAFGESRILRSTGCDSDTSTSKAMTRKDKFYDQHFASDGDCYEHDRYKCDDCLQSVYEARANANSNSLTLVVSDTSTSTAEKANAYENFQKQQKYIRKALKISDKSLAQKKMTEIPQLMEKAAKEITVGSMNELLEEEHIPTGVLRSVYYSFMGFSRIFRKRRR